MATVLDLPQKALLLYQMEDGQFEAALRSHDWVVLTDNTNKINIANLSFHVYNEKDKPDRRYEALAKATYLRLECNVINIAALLSNNRIQKIALTKEHLFDLTRAPPVSPLFDHKLTEIILAPLSQTDVSARGGVKIRDIIGLFPFQTETLRLEYDLDYNRWGIEMSTAKRIKNHLCVKYLFVKIKEISNYFSEARDYHSMLSFIGQCSAIWGRMDTLEINICVDANDSWATFFSCAIGATTISSINFQVVFNLTLICYTPGTINKVKAMCKDFIEITPSRFTKMAGEGTKPIVCNMIIEDKCRP